MFSSFALRSRGPTRPRPYLQTLEGRDVPSGAAHVEWIDLNGDGEDQGDEYFESHGNRLVHLGDRPEGLGRPGAIRWIDLNHDQVRQGNETFLVLRNGDLERVTLSGPTARPWLINDLRRYGDDSLWERPDAPWIHWLINDLRRYGDWQEDDITPSGPCPNYWYDAIHGGMDGISIVCNGRTTTTTIKFKDGTVSETKETDNGNGVVISRVVTDFHPDGSVDRTVETKNREQSTTTATTHWNGDGSGSMTTETKDKDGKTTSRVTAEYDKDGNKIAQTEQVGDKTKSWKKDPKSKAWSNSEDLSAKKPPNEQKGGLPERLPSKPAKPK